MTSHIFRGRILGQGKAVDVRLAEGRIVSVRAAGKGDPGFGHEEAVFAPPLVDIQVNGANGIDLQSPDLTAAAVAELNEYMLAQGVGKWVPTLITNSVAALARNAAVIAEAMADRRLARHIPGIHLEGPFISPDDGPRGAHPRKHVKKPDIAAFDRLLDAAQGKVIYTTVAPDQPGAIPFIKAIVKRGVVVSLGHHMASAEQIHAAAAAGATLATHLGNGLAPQINRFHNPLWPQMADDRLHASLIADLQHLPPDMLKAFIAAKGPGKIVLTSDSMHIAGLKPGRYEVAGQAVELTKERRINLLGTQLLAGSALQLLQGAVNAANVGGIALAEAFAAASAVPARLLGFAAPKFELRPGQLASALLYETNRLGTARPLAALHGGRLVMTDS